MTRNAVKVTYGIFTTLMTSSLKVIWNITNIMNVKMSMLGKKNRIQNYQYKLENARRKYTNILTVGNGTRDDFLFILISIFQNISNCVLP